MVYAVTPAQMREAEQKTIAAGIPSILLMERAALEMAHYIKGMGGIHSVLVICGPGNNGGDGMALARILHLNGYFVEVLLCGQEKYSGDAQKNLKILKAAGVPILSALPGASYDLIVDAIFGTGFSRAPEGIYQKAIAWINDRPKGTPALSVDIPSGVDGETGKTPGAAVNADMTISFEYPKLGHLFYPGRERSGELAVAKIGLFPTEPYPVSYLEDSDIPSLLPKRPADGYKNTFGHGLLIAGSKGMAGACLLAANAALHSGIGLLSCAADETCVMPHLQSRVPSAMVHGLQMDEDIPPQVEKAFPGKSAVAIGPGLGQTQAALQLLQAAWEAPLPLVVDADGLNLLAAHRPMFNKRSFETILTPHPGEMRRLLGRDVAESIEDALLLAREMQAIVVLKGATSVIAAPDGSATLNLSGSSALAKGGSGDVLTGITLALLAQGLHGYDAARLAAYLHGQSGQRLSARSGEAGFTSWDLSACNHLSFK